jgi:hypothetical protein
MTGPLENYISCVNCRKEQPEACFDCPACPAPKEQLEKELKEKREKEKELVFLIRETYRGVIRRPESLVYIGPRKFMNDREISEHFFQCVNAEKLPENVLRPILKRTRPSFVFVMTEPNECPNCKTRLSHDLSLVPFCPKCNGIIPSPYELPPGKEIQEGGF